MKKEVISIRKLVSKNTTEKITERIKDNGTIEGISCKFYPGQQKSLRVFPVVVHKGEKREDLLSFPDGCDGFLSGDDDYFKFEIVIPCENDDYIEITATNTDLANDYTLCVDVSIDYYAGKSRVIGGVI